MPAFLRSARTVSNYLNLGLPTFLLPFGFSSNRIRGNLFLSIHKTWPSHSNLLSLMSATISLSLYKCNSAFVLIRHVPWSQIGPKIFLKIFLSQVFSIAITRSDKVQASLPYTTTRFNYCFINSYFYFSGDPRWLRW